MNAFRSRRTVAGLMVVVASVAVGLGAIRLMSRRAVYLERANDHAGFRDLILWTPETIQYWEARWTDQRAGKGGSYPWPDGPPFVPAMVAYREAMRAKWERAARLPWLSVEPDPIP